MTDVFAWRVGAAAMVCMMVLVGWMLALAAQRAERIEARLCFALGQRTSNRVAQTRRLDDLLGALRRLGSVIIESGVLSRKAVADLEQTLAAAGHRPASALSLVVGGKVALLILLPVVAWLLTAGAPNESHRLMSVAAGASIGMILPDLIIGRLRKKYLASVERGLADALDLLVICADAGLPLESALERVASEFRDSDPATANELALTAGEMKMRPDRRQALADLGTRTGLDTLMVLGGTLAQTLQYGTPLAQALRTLSMEMRQTMLARFEERAARLPVLLALPTMIFFLPCVILVAGGPAAVTIFHMLKG